MVAEFYPHKKWDWVVWLKLSQTQPKNTGKTNIFELKLDLGITYIKSIHWEQSFHPWRTFRGSSRQLQ